MFPQRTFGGRRPSTERLVRRLAGSLGEPASLATAGMLWCPSRNDRALHPEALAICREHLDALYLLALLYTGVDQLANEAVVDAVVSAVNEPSIAHADPAWAWFLLAAPFCVPNEETVVRGSMAATVRMAGLSVVQRETMALIVAGRSPDDVAALLKVPIAQVHNDFRAGAWALNTAVRSEPEISAGLRLYP